MARQLHSTLQTLLSPRHAERFMVGDSDVLLDLVTHSPREAVWFIKVILLCGGIFGVVTSLPCVAFASLYWERCGSCNKPLRYWLVLYAALQLLQSPVRLYFYTKVSQAERANASLPACVRQLTSSPIWKVSKMGSFFMYAWFVLGIVWALNSKACPGCPGVWRLTVLVIVTTFARLGVAVICFYFNFSDPSRVLTAATLKTRGVSEEELKKLPLEEFLAATGHASLGKGFEETWSNIDIGAQECKNDCCAVCLVDYEQGDLVRPLPCNHRFHRACIDTWLRQRPVCPLCMQNIRRAKGKAD